MFYSETGLPLTTIARAGRRSPSRLPSSRTATREREDSAPFLRVRAARARLPAHPGRAFDGTLEPDDHALDLLALFAGY